MAREQIQQTNLGRNVVVTLFMILSATVFAGIVWMLLWYRTPEGTNRKAETAALQKAYAETDTEFKNIVTTLFTKREPVEESTLMGLSFKFAGLHETTKSYMNSAHTYSLAVTLLPKISERIKKIDRLQLVNQALLAEGQIGESLSAFTTCTRKINYSKTAKTIQVQLEECTELLQQAQGNVMVIPTEALAYCPTAESPGKILQEQAKIHGLLVNFYRLSAQQKATEAAKADKTYKDALEKFRNLPAWNSCITEFLRKERITLGV